jgi:transposase-like protein
MSKIPQGEWNAIAARYARGESISKIAQRYGCTPPAIHYILKRAKQRTAPAISQPLKAGSQALSTSVHYPVQSPGASENARLTGLPNEQLGTARPQPTEGRSATMQPVELRLASDREISSERETPNERPQTALPPQPPQSSRSFGQSSSFTAGLDSELQGRAEAAIAAFRLSFDAALAVSSPNVRHQLRRAASDLMRVAARTTIVLDRLNATAVPADRRVVDQSRSGRTRY